MNEGNLIYDQVPAVANLNKVEGFDPQKHLRAYGDDRTGESQWYLDVKYRKLWFRLKYPTGKIIKKVIQLTDRVATIEARVYFDFKDTEDHFVASALAQRYFDDSPMGPKYVELAETAAVGRALADAGFGVQFCDVTEGNDPVIVDAGVPAPVLNAGSAVEENAGTAASADTAKTGHQSAAGPSAPTAAGTGAPAAAKPARGLVTPPAPSYTTSTPVEEILKVMTVEEAKSVAVDFKSGALKGKTLAQIAFESPKDLQWIVNNYRGANNILRAGAQKLLDAAVYQPELQAS